jgi:hypothetical protein
MSKKYPITISEARDGDAGVYSISFTESWGGRYDLRAFNSDGYLRKFSSLFKDSQAIAYALCEFALGRFCGSVDLSEVLPKAASSHPLCRIPQRSHFFGETRGLETRCLIVKEHDFQWFQQLVEQLSHNDQAFCAVLFDFEGRSQELLDQFQQLFGKQGLHEKGVELVAIEGIELAFGCCGAEDGFSVYTHRFDLEGIHALLSKAVDFDRFELRYGKVA